MDIQPKLGIPAVTVVYTVLHAGGKFGGEDSGYKVAGGLHGVGASVVNALSEWLVVHVRRDGAEYEQSFKRGKPDGDLKKIGVAASTGTTVTFKPDPEMFTEDGAIMYRSAQYAAKYGTVNKKKTEDGTEEEAKDEVLVRANGIPTYFAADIAYHYNKLATRGFAKAIDVWGADHHGHVARMKGAMDAIGLNGEDLDVLLL